MGGGDPRMESVGFARGGGGLTEIHRAWGQVWGAREERGWGKRREVCVGRAVSDYALGWGGFQEFPLRRDCGYARVGGRKKAALRVGRAALDEMTPTGFEPVLLG